MSRGAFSVPFGVAGSGTSFPYRDGPGVAAMGRNRSGRFSLREKVAGVARRMRVLARSLRKRAVFARRPHLALIARSEERAFFRTPYGACPLPLRGRGDRGSAALTRVGNEAYIPCEIKRPRPAG